MCRISRNIKVNMMPFNELPVNSRGTAEDSSTDSICANENDYFGLRDSIITDIQRFRHISGYWSGYHDSVGVTG